VDRCRVVREGKLVREGHASTSRRQEVAVKEGSRLYEDVSIAYYYRGQKKS